MSDGKRIRVLVVDDSITVRKRIVEVLAGDRTFEVIGEAGDGRTAIELCERLRPDVMTLDMMLPVMSGLAVTEYVMAYCPTPIVIVSASVNRGEMLRTLDALAAGALDVLDKPGADDADDGDRAWEARLRATVRVVSRVRVISHPRAKLQGVSAHPLPAATPAPPERGRPDVCAMGASTGGPHALAAILRALPPAVDLPIVLVVHIDQRFDASLADWLDGVSPRRVRLAEDGMPLPRRGQPMVLVAPANRHLVAAREGLRLTNGPERHSCRPSVDVLFESVAAVYGARALGCLLTGMGVDGAAGLLAMRHAGGHTIAQDEASSVVFGMPGQAVRLGAATEVVPLDAIAERIGQLAGHGGAMR